MGSGDEGLYKITLFNFLSHALLTVFFLLLLKYSVCLEIKHRESLENDEEKYENILSTKYDIGVIEHSRFLRYLI